MGGIRRWIRQNKSEDLERKASQWHYGRDVFLSPTVTLQLCQGWRQHAQQSRSYSKYTLPPSTTAPMVSLFSHPFSSCHWKCYRQLVKVHYTLSSWPEIYTPQCFCRTAEEECNPLRTMTVGVSWWKLPNVDFPLCHCTVAQWYVNSHTPAAVL